MKNQLNVISRCALSAVAAGALCLGGQVSAQVTAEPEGPPMGTSSMAGVGQKPRKSDAKKSDPTRMDSATNPKMSAQMEGAAMADMDRQFVQMAAMDGMKEVHMGQMAVDKGQSAEVKKLGSRIVADHTKANSELKAIAAKRGMKLNTSHKMDKMTKKEMANFDQAWLAMMVNDHQKDIAAYDKTAKMGTDPELKSYASKTLPVLKKHLAMVQAAQKKMSSTAPAPNS